MLSTTNACKITDGIYIACNRKYSEILFGVLIFGEGCACLKAIFYHVSKLHNKSFGNVCMKY